jgi:GTP-binding protein
MELISTSYTPEQFPKKVHHSLELALIGRSNVGKSTLINHLGNNRHLAKISARPGKTKSINFYKQDHLLLVDLPGYGFAHRTQEERAQFGTLTDAYFKRPPDGILFLLDARHDPSEEDFAFFTWCPFPLLFVFTKTDKLGASERLGQCERLASHFPGASWTVPKAAAPFVKGLWAHFRKKPSFASTVKQPDSTPSKIGSSKSP